MHSTQASDLLGNSEFVKQARYKVPAKNLQEFAPDRSVRWLQEVCKSVRDYQSVEMPIESAPVVKTSEPDWVKSISGNKSYKVPTIELPSQTQWLRLEGDFALVSDIHIPFYHAPTLERLMTDADRVGVRRLVIMGDLLDFNQFNHKRGANYQRRAQDDVEAAKPVLRSLRECFETIYIFMGNHDEWIAQHMRNHFDASFLFDSFFSKIDGLEWSSYGQAEVFSGGKPWRLIHGANFSAPNPAGVAKALASKFQSNIAMGHQHLPADDYDVSGQFQCVCLGGAYDLDKMGYCHYHPRRGCTPRRSVGILKEGFLHHIKDV